MPKCTDQTIGFGRLGRRVIEANFEGGDIGSDGGVLLLKRVDERIGLSRAAAAVLSIRAIRRASRTVCEISWRSASTRCAVATRISTTTTRCETTC